MACHNWDYCLMSSQANATGLIKNRAPRLHMSGYQDTNPNHGCRVPCPINRIWQNILSMTVFLNIRRYSLISYIKGRNELKSYSVFSKIGYARTWKLFKHGIMVYISMTLKRFKLNGKNFIILLCPFLGGVRVVRRFQRIIQAIRRQTPCTLFSMWIFRWFVAINVTAKFRHIKYDFLLQAVKSSAIWFAMCDLSWFQYLFSHNIKDHQNFRLIT